MIAKIVNLNSSKRDNICAVDASTNNIAFAIFNNKKLNSKY